MNTNVYSIQHGGINRMKTETLEDEWIKNGKFEMVTSSIFGILAVEMQDQYVQYIHSRDPDKNSRISIPEELPVTKVRHAQVTKDGRMCVFYFYLPAGATHNMLRLSFDENGVYTEQKTFRYVLDVNSQWPFLHFTCTGGADEYAVSYTKNDILIHKYKAGSLSPLSTIKVASFNSLRELKAVNISPKIENEIIHLWYVISDCGSKNTTLMIGDATLYCSRINVSEICDETVLPEPIGSLPLGYSNRVDFSWSDDSVYALLMSQCSIDIEKGTYGGTTKLYILKHNAAEMRPVITTSDVQCANWRPHSHDYLTIEGKSYNRIFYRAAADPSKWIHEFPKGYKNTICWNYQGNAVALGGFGQMAGDIAIWFINEDGAWECVAEWRESCTVKLSWAPDGETLLLASTYPRMKIDNFVKLFTNNGVMLKELHGHRILDAFYEATIEKLCPPKIPEKNPELMNKPKSGVYRTRQQLQNNSVSEVGAVLQDLAGRGALRKDKAATRPKKADVNKKTKEFKEPWRPRKIDAGDPCAKEEEMKDNNASSTDNSVSTTIKHNLLNAVSPTNQRDDEVFRDEVTQAAPADKRKDSVGTTTQPGMTACIGDLPEHPDELILYQPDTYKMIDVMETSWKNDRMNPVRQLNYPMMGQPVSMQEAAAIHTMQRQQQQQRRKQPQPLPQPQQMAYSSISNGPVSYRQRPQTMAPWNQDDLQRFYAYGVGQHYKTHEPLRVMSDDVKQALVMTDAETQAMWQYVDSGRYIQGAFSTAQMRFWYNQGYLRDDLEVRMMPHHKFLKLNSMFCGREPFSRNDVKQLIQQTGEEVGIDFNYLSNLGPAYQR